MVKTKFWTAEYLGGDSKEIATEIATLWLLLYLHIGCFCGVCRHHRNYCVQGLDAFNALQVFFFSYGDMSGSTCNVIA